MMSRRAPRPQLTTTPLAVAAASTLAFLLGGGGCATGEANSVDTPNSPTLASSSEWSSKGRSVTGVSEPLPAAAREMPFSAREIAPPPSAEQIPVDVVDAGGRPDPIMLRQEAVGVVERASHKAWALLRAHAIEASLTDPSVLDSIASRGLVDSNRGVRFVAAMAIAKAKRCDLVHLVEPLTSDPSDSVRAAALAALSMCGRNPDLTPLAAMVTSNDPEVRSNAYMALGVIGNRSAIPMIRASLGRGMDLVNPVRVRIVELQAAECLVRLGESQEIEPIRAALFAPSEQSELTVLACQMVGRIGDQSARTLLRRLIEASGNQTRPLEVRLAAAEALARLGDADSRDSLELAAAGSRDESGAVRSQAATVLGTVGGEQALVTLRTLLTDPDPVVQIAAAGGVVTATRGTALASGNEG